MRIKEAVCEFRVHLWWNERKGKIVIRRVTKKYLQISQEDINEQAESTNQETIDINKFVDRQGFRETLRVDEGKWSFLNKSAITPISYTTNTFYTLYKYNTYFSKNINFFKLKLAK